MADRWQIQPGKYEYTRSDGTRGVNTIGADGTFRHEPEGGVVESGTWREEADWSCITPSEGAERRYAFSQPDADGRFSGRMDNGITAEMRKIG
jgi:hypothetical protein